jgi:hypothetical protein
VPLDVDRQSRRRPLRKSVLSRRDEIASDCWCGVVFPDPNIYRAVGLLIWCHGATANIEAARIADTMHGFGDRDGQAFWIKVGQAITDLQA